MLTSLKTKITFVFFFISYIAIAQWAQVGQDIDGDFLDNAGFSVDLSNNGNLMVIGYPRNDNNGQDSGAVKVFQKNNDTWIQIGTEINGDNSNDQFGTAVSMSGDGLLVAIGNNNGGFSGQVKVFKLQNQNWQQVGSEINGLEVGSLFGRSLSISNDGNNLIVGAPGFYTNTQSGYVEIYQYINNIWQQKGQGIPGANFGDSFGGSVSISDDGLTIAIGAPGNDFIGNGSGLVKIYKYINNNWVQKGNTIYGDTSGDLLGTSLSLSQDGNIIAIGATEGFNINTQSGYAKIFEFNNSIWNQIGGDINGQNVGDLFGFSIDISDNGNTVVIGAIGNNNNGAIAGSTRVFSLTNNVWAQISQNINGENQSDNSGHSVAINSVGNLIAIGARTAKNNNNQPTGHVRVYENPNVSNCNITVDNFSDVNTSNPYTLPALTNGNYFTDQGGLGTALNAGDIISTTQTIYIYNEDPNDPNCNAESSFTITINTPPAQTYVPDDGFETRLQTLGLDSGPLDDYVLTANINTLTAIDLSGAGIADLTGIEGFVALEQLYVENNNLTSVDLSSNTALTNLDINNNQLTALNLTANTNLQILSAEFNQLSSINLNGLNNLQELYIRDNLLTSIDLSNLLGLIIFSGYNNNFTNLDASQNTNLSIFLANGNDLTSLDIRNANNTNIVGNFFTTWANPDLTCIFVDDATYSAANWTSIDAASTFVENQAQCDALGDPPAGLTYVPDDNFENYLETHDANGNVVAIGDINSMGNGIANDDYVFTDRIDFVTDLNLSFIPSLNISSLVGIADFVVLTDLNCSNNNLTQLDVSNNINLINLACRFNQLNNLILNNTTQNSLGFIDCGVNQLSNIDLTNIALLGTLAINDNNFSSIDLSNTSVGILNVFNNNISSLNVANDTVLQILSCENNQISSLDLSTNSNLSTLRCQNNQLSFLDLRNGNNADITNAVNINQDFFNATGNPNLGCIFVDEAITSSLFWNNIDNTSTFVENQAQCDALNDPCNITVDNLNDTTECGDYILPALSNGNYYSQSGGSGTVLNAGDVISATQTIYIYNEDPNDPSCNAESSFIVTINDSPNVDILNDVTSCSSFSLPSLTNGQYFTQPGGNGTQLNSGDVISTSQTIYIYNEQNGCSSESSFTITIGSGGSDEWVQIGQDIDGDIGGSLFGNVVAMSDDGNIVATGGNVSTNSNFDPGFVRVYANLAGIWTQLGQDIFGENNEDNTVHSISMSANGNIIAIGTKTNGENGTNSGQVRVFQHSNNIWTQLGQDLNGYSSGTFFGSSTSLSSSGNILAVGGPGYNNGQSPSLGIVKIFEYNSGNWLQMGNDIIGSQDHFVGSEIDLASDGITVAVSEINQNYGIAPAIVKVYKKVNDTWIQLGQDLDAQNLGYNIPSISISSDGNIVAVGKINQNVNSGKVTVYSYNSSAWMQVGTEIGGESEYDHSGHEVKLSHNGNIIAIGAPNNDGNGTSSGHVRVYKNLSGTWTQIGEDIDGEATGDLSGKALAISSGGNILAIGAANNDANGSSSGHIRLYSLQSSQQPTLVDTLPDVTECDSYTLPALTNGNYFTQSGGTGTSLNEGDVITTTQTIYIYNEDPSDASCSAESSFTVTITPTPNVDTLNDVSACNSFTLPSLTDGNYYSQSNQGGTAFSAGDVITTSKTLYIYNEVNGCSNESSFVITITTEPPVDILPDVDACDEYTFQALTNGNYFTQSGGTGTALNDGDVISTTQTIYIYNEDPSDGSCSAESSFTVSITPTPNVDTLSDVSACNSFTLPSLTDGNYYSQSNQSGTAFSAGDVITTSQTLYIYNEVNGCSNESSFDITVSPIPNVDVLDSVLECELYELPPLTNGEYFSNTNGNGTQLNEGDIITTSQLIYIFNEENGCTNESSFFVELIKPDVDVLNDVSECEFYILPPLTIGNYFTEPGGQGLLLLQGDFITISETIYIYAEADELANCSGESSFNVEILISEDFTLNESSIIKEGLNIEVDIETELVELEYAVDNNHFQSTNVFTNLSEGDHILYVRGINNCVEKSILFFIKDKYFKFPQFFTPNGDGINDYWIIEDLENEIEKVVIFDRYGKLLQIIYPNNSIWDGSAGGRQLPSSDYWFKAVFFNGKIQTGHVTLKR